MILYFKESRTKIHPEVKVITDTGYQGIQRLHVKSELPKNLLKIPTLMTKSSENRGGGQPKITIHVEKLE